LAEPTKTIDRDDLFSEQSSSINIKNQKEAELLKELEEKQREIERLSSELQIMAKESSSKE